MEGRISERDFGCQRCWPADPEVAWEARGALAHAVELIDESHWHVVILECPVCSQRFVSIFAETIDWVDGDDPQYWSLLPVTRAEVDDLARRGDALTEAQLGWLGRGRRCLRVEHPKGETRRVFWVTGVWVDPHD